MNKTIIVDGMSCQHCVSSIKEALENINVEDIVINLDKREVKLNSNNVSDSIIKKAIEDIGFDIDEIK